MTAEAVGAAIQQLYRSAHAQLVATLARHCSDIQLAEDAVQDAFVRAMQHWQAHGSPERPVAWLARTARNAAIDRLRHRRVRDDAFIPLQQQSQLEQGDMMDQQHPDAYRSHPVLRDDMLRLVFTCCHPALSMEARVALSLKTICGFNTQEIAAAFLVSEATMSQRLLRAKQKIKKAGIPFQIPEADEIENRLASVHAVIYLIYNEGYKASLSVTGLRNDVAEQAIFLASLLHQLMPGNGATDGLYALLLLQHSRRAARVDADGGLVLLRDQDRRQWDKKQIRAGLSLLADVFSGNRGDNRYAIQAAIAAMHAQAPNAAQTDWCEICRLYEHLRLIDPSPVVELNYAVAVAEAGDLSAATELVATLHGNEAMQRFYLFHAVYADLLERSDRLDSALQHYRTALELVTNAAERALLQGKLDRLIH
jgi:RNA polymerase sigma-70 factor (ECF subfamily)